MKCPKCSAATRVVETRSDRDQFHHVNEIGTVLRRRKCGACGYAFKTVERVVTDKT